MSFTEEFIMFLCNKEQPCKNSPSCGKYCNHTTYWRFAKNFHVINHAATLFGIEVAKELYFEKDYSHITDDPPIIIYKEKEDE